MARKPGRILPFRIPFFRIFYSTTYTILYAIEILLLAITPASLIYSAIVNRAFQYILIVGSVYVLVALLATFIYSSRLYTNRTVLAAVGKAYIPVEEGEVGKNVRKMIVKQLERSAIIAWEAKPRNAFGEIYAAEQNGVLPAETHSVNHNDYTVGRIIQIDPAQPPWGIVRHAGWSSPSQRDDNKYPNVQFADVIAEMPNLIEAKAALADSAVVELLTRPTTMGMRDYIKQLAYLGLINPADIGDVFMRQYEHARFCGRPVTEYEFADLMATFSELLAGMVELDQTIFEQIRSQTADDVESDLDEPEPARSRSVSAAQYLTPRVRCGYSPATSALSVPSPVTAREHVSRSATPYMHGQSSSLESFSSVIHNSPSHAPAPMPAMNTGSSSLVDSDAGSVIHHDMDAG
ncbi:hypothetical protein LTR78_004134 [Recurvomyces mirabilis]|uniref:Defect at low temperature protein 1 n=1 Tax=Recurvomyces mirabilis TaxID=574656 RepID=A0AAE1C2X2_9PEZI|nr:hypothetical protein LTR78_004134 [Recurvomyces mirabilis]KAK5153695.1 hypothetical protein LTS14_007389 [Recurvomyces mirabilis]